MPDPDPSGPAPDRDLLLGLLALQGGLLTREALAPALAAWAADPATPLGRLLLARGSLTLQGLGELEGLVEERLRPAGDGWTVAPSIPPEVTGPYTPSPDGAAGPAAPDGTADPGQRYQVLRPHARGGLGEVFVALDQELHREVALKEMRQPFADDPYCRRRFVREAEVTGRLEHPGIVPVYGLGHYADGRPFYAMRFVQGDTLQEAVRRFHAADVPGRDPGERSLALRQLLGRFVAVCNAVAYAHSRGVLHRDLKPANALLGPYGETLLVDWGLAKPLGRPDGEPTRVEATWPTEEVEGLETRIGTALGTPAYMSPEQAQGRWNEVGPASDIYGLGATLYALLTGSAPVQGRDQGEVLERVARGEWLPPGRVKAGLPPALDAICRQAMARRPADRYSSALALAADVEHWLADEPVSAYREPLRVRARRWARRHKPAVAAMAAAVLVALLLGGGTWLWLRADRDARQAQLTRDVNAALTKALDLRARAKVAPVGQAGLLARAREQVQRAQALVESGPADAALKAQVAQLQAELDQEEKDRQLLAALDEARLAQAGTAAGQRRFARERAVPRFRKALQEYGLEVGEGEPGVVAARLRGRPAPVREAVSASLDEWLDLATNPGFSIREPHRKWLWAVAAAAEPDDKWARQFRAALARKGRAKQRRALKELARAANVRKLSPRVLTRLAERLGDVGAEASAVALLRRAHRQHPADFWINQLLGMALEERKPPELGEAVRYYTAAVAVRSESSGAHLNLGNALKAKGRLGEAIACYRKAIALDPKDATAHHNLGVVLRDKGRLNEAITRFRKALALDPKYANAHLNLGVALHSKGRLEEAIAYFRKAIACYRKALALDPEEAKAEARAHNGLGVALKDKGRLDEAIARIRKALVLDPKLAEAHLNLGAALQAKGRLGEAIACYRQALALDPKDAAAHFNLGSALLAKGRLDRAIAHYRKAIALDPKLADPKLAQVHSDIGIALLAQGKRREAMRALRRAIALDPKYAPAHGNLGLALYVQGKLVEAVKEFRRAIALDPKQGKAHGGLGFALHKLGRFAEARRAVRRCLRLLPAGDPSRRLYTGLLRQCQQLLALDRKLTVILQGKAKPTSPTEQLGLAYLCQRYKQRYAAAARFFAEAFTSQPNITDDPRSGHRYNAACAAALAGCGQGSDAAKLDAKEKGRLRGQALTWLKADLVVQSKQLTGGEPPDRQVALQTLRHWRKDPDLAGVRDQEALAKLPEAERKEWAKFWAEAAALLKKTGPQ
jgi:tetratricopeptide (TPR) repeat protein/tRNA A-37 threonylcarbamoyl transferase component Bud32